MGARRPERHPDLQKPPPRRERAQPGTPLVTLQQLRDASPWWWMICRNPRCGRSAPIAVLPYIIRWGPQEEVERLRRSAKCTCGHVGASLSMPSWGGADIGFMPWPDRFRAAAEPERPPAVRIPLSTKGKNHG